MNHSKVIWQRLGRGLSVKMVVRFFSVTRSYTAAGGETSFFDFFTITNPSNFFLLHQVIGNAQFSPVVGVPELLPVVFQVSQTAGSTPGMQQPSGYNSGGGGMSYSTLITAQIKDGNNFAPVAPIPFFGVTTFNFQCFKSMAAGDIVQFSFTFAYSFAANLNDVEKNV